MSLDPIFGAWNVLGFVDDQLSLRGRMIEGVPVLGSVEEFLAANVGRSWYFHCAVGSNQQRQKLALQFESAGFQPATIMDPMTIISPRATVGAGSYVAPRCYIGPRATLGRHVLINVSASVGHHSVVGDFAQVCPGVRVNGHCKIGKMAFLGSNAVIHPGKRVGENATVAAGSFVVRDVAPNTLVLGVPAMTVHHTPTFEFESNEQEVPAPAATSSSTPAE